MAQEHKDKATSKSTDEQPIDTTPAPTEEEQAAKASMDDDVDDLLDEIDDVLEENSEEFVRGYVQKGGQ